MDQTRGLFSRVGLILLNLPAPGLGLLRLRRWKTALAIFGITMLVLIFFNLAPPVPFAVLLLAAIIAVANLFAALWLTWRNSRNVEADLPWYSHWYSIVGAALFALIINVLLTDPDRLTYRNFYIPGEGMAPTLPKVRPIHRLHGLRRTAATL